MIPRLATRGKLILGTALLFLLVGALHGAPPLVGLAGAILTLLLALYLGFYPTAILLRRKKIELYRPNPNIVASTEANTDFVFPIIGEELGMWVTLAVVASFLILMLCAGWISIHAPDPSGVLLGVGITLMIALQALMNLAVVTSLMPCKGIPLPFISYGRSNLLTCLAAIGILFNMHRQGVYQTPAPKTVKATAFSVRM